jgi:signal transduction histidine kinase
LQDSSVWKKLYNIPRERTGFVEGAATLLTTVMFVATYWVRSLDGISEVTSRGLFLIGTLVLCSMVIFGVLVRHFLPFISHMIVLGACTIGLSQITAFLAQLEPFQRAPIIGRNGWGYMVHHDDMLLYPGFILMLGGFYLTILHAARMRQELVSESHDKEKALRSSERSAAVLARRVEFENLASGVSTRFVNLDHDEIDGELNRSLAELGEFAGVDRAYVTFTKLGLGGVADNFEWCAPGVASFNDATMTTPLENFAWSVGLLSAGETVRVQKLSELPPTAAYERAWFKEQGVKSLINVPLFSSHMLRGYIGFDTVNREMTWPEESEVLLRIIGEILLSAWDRRCAEQQRRLLELQVRQAQNLESLGVMAGGIAHDFNNLLTGIMGNAELAQLDLPEDSSSYRYLDGVSQSARRAAELCRQMLAYAGRGKFVTQPIDLNSLIDDMMPLLRASVSKRAVLVLDLADDLPEIDGDISQFRQILGNLIVNASESLEDHPGSVTIRTGSQYCTEAFLKGTYLAEPLPPGDYVVLDVVDTGTGMTEDVIEKAFEPFFTTRFAGRGLGMPAVLGVVRSHRGAVRLESAPGIGTTIQLLFPVDTIESNAWLVAGEAAGDWHRQGTVLLADDEDMVLSVGSMMLRHLGLNVVTATNGDDAVERAQLHGDTLQCVILDYEMPGLETETACDRIKNAFPETPIIVSSGHAQRDVLGHFAEGTVDAFLSKPFELSSLQSVMRGLITTGNSRRR